MLIFFIKATERKAAACFMGNVVLICRHFVGHIIKPMVSLVYSNTIKKSTNVMMIDWCVLIVVSTDQTSAFAAFFDPIR